MVAMRKADAPLTFLILLVFSLSSIFIHPSSAACSPRSPLFLSEFPPFLLSPDTAGKSSVASPPNNSASPPSSPSPLSSPPPSSSPSPSSSPHSSPSPSSSPRSSPSPSSSPRSSPSPSSSQSPSSSPLSSPSPSSSPRSSPSPSSSPLSSPSPSSSPSSSPSFAAAPASDGPSPSGGVSLPELCDATDYKKLCISAATSFLSTLPGPIDAEMVLKLQIQALQKQVDVVKARVAELLEDPKQDKSALQECAGNMNDESDLLKESEQALGERDRGTLNARLSAIAADNSACEMGFDDNHESFPLAKECDIVDNLTDNCLALVDLVFPPVLL